MNTFTSTLRFLVPTSLSLCCGSCSISLSHRTKTSHPTPLCLDRFVGIVFWTHGKPLSRQLLVVVWSECIYQLPTLAAKVRRERVRQRCPSWLEVKHWTLLFYLPAAEQHSFMQHKRTSISPQVVKTMAPEKKEQRIIYHAFTWAASVRIELQSVCLIMHSYCKHAQFPDIQFKSVDGLFPNHSPIYYYIPKEICKMPPLVNHNLIPFRIWMSSIRRK